MFKIIVDPTDYYTDENHHKIVAYCQTVINWALNPSFTKTSFKASILQQYLYGSNWCMKGTIDHNGIYYFPEDPPLHPMLSISKNNDCLYFYEHDIIALKDDKQPSGFYITRVD